MRLRLLLPGYRSHRLHFFRFTLVFFGIALGAALCSFVFLINSATMNSLEKGIRDLAGETDLVVSATGGQSFPDSTLDRVLKIPGIASAVPVIQKRVSAVLPNGDETSLNLLGLDLLNDSAVRSHGSETRRLVADPLSFLASANSVALTTTFASERNLVVGSSLQLMTSTGLKKFVVRALISEFGPGKKIDRTLAIMDIEATRLAFGLRNQTDQINIALEDKGAIAQVQDSAQSTLGDAFAVEPPSAQMQSLRDIVIPFQNLLTFLASLACVMAFFLISNTARLSLTERRREISILRAMGASRKTIFQNFISEYGVIGLTAATTGSFIAWSAVRIFWNAIQQGLASQTQTGIDFAGESFGTSIPFFVSLAGTFLTLGAVLLPILSLTHVTPAEILQGSGPAAPARRRNSSPWRRRALHLVGVLCLLPLFPLPESFAEIKFLHVMPLFGATILAPPLAMLILIVSRKFVAPLPVPMIRLAWGYAVSNPERVEKSLHGISLGLLLTFTITSVQRSFTDSLTNMFVRTARPDFYVSSRGDFLSPMGLQPLDDHLQDELRRVPGVAGVYGQRIIQLKYNSRTIKLSAFDEVPPDTLKVPYSYFEVVDRPVPDAGKDLYRGDRNAIFISESFQKLFKKKTGDRLELGVLGRPMEFHVVGVVRDFTAGGGRLYISRDHFKSLWHDSLVTGIAIVVAENNDLATVRSSVEKSFGAKRGLMTTVDRGIKTDVDMILQRTFLTFSLIELICVFVASLGFLSSFFIEIQNRSAEIASLRIVGTSRKEVSLFLGIEALLIGVSASLVSVGFAIPITFRLISRSLPNLLGWVVEFHFDAKLCALTVLLGACLAILVAFYAVHWLWRFNVGEAIQNE